MAQLSKALVYHWEPVKQLFTDEDEYAHNWITNLNFRILDSSLKKEETAVSKLLYLNCKYTRERIAPLQRFGDYLHINSEGHISFIDIGANNASLLIHNKDHLRCNVVDREMHEIKPTSLNETNQIQWILIIIQQRLITL
eukprot:979845_1